jgi:hypothetical protein
MHQDLYLHESILLLSLDDEKGSFSTDETYLQYAFSAALLLDLVLAERIGLEEQYLRLKTNAVTDNRLLNEVLRRIQEAKKPGTLGSWLHGLVLEDTTFRARAIDQLVSRNILERKKDKFLWVFNVTRYPAVNSQPENALRARLQAIIFGDAPPTPQERMLLAIIQACQMEKALVPAKDKRKMAKEKIAALTEASEMRKLLGEVIAEMEAMIVVITTIVT